MKSNSAKHFVTTSGSPIKVGDDDGMCGITKKPNTYNLQIMALFEYTKDDRETSKLGISRKNLDWEESLISGAKSSDGESMDVVSKFKKGRMMWFVVAVVLIMGMLVFKTAYMQFVEGKNLRIAAEENRIRTIPELAPRGVIKDRNGEVIAQNSPSFNLVYVPSDISSDEAEMDKSLTKISEVAGVSLDELKKTIEEAPDNSFEAYILIADLPKESALKLISIKDSLGGFYVQDVAIREYTQKEIFAHVLGYTGLISKEEYEEKANGDIKYYFNDYIGKSGIEKTYENFLRGEPGMRQIEVDSMGREEKELAYKEPESGSDVVLGIDAKLQKFLYERLSEVSKESGSGKASAVAMNPKTGEILSMVSVPSYDNNLFSKTKDKEYAKLFTDETRPLLNRAITGVYPPGSTVKPGVAVAALEEDVITPNTTIMDKGEISVAHKYDPSIVYKFVGYERSGLGLVDVYTYISKSSDIFSYYIGGGYGDFKGLGLTKLKNWYELFGFGSALGIDIEGEASGLIPDEEWKQKVKGEAWYLGDLYHLSIGQGDMLATPLQLVSYISTIANGGSLVKPHLVKSIVNLETQKTTTIETEVIRENFASSESISVVREAMRRTVTDGSGRALNTLPFTSAGKTGTAQYVEDGDKKEHAWYVSFAPYEDPEIALVILVEGGGEGFRTAVPVAKDALEHYFNEKQD